MCNIHVLCMCIVYLCGHVPTYIMDTEIGICGHLIGTHAQSVSSYIARTIPIRWVWHAITTEPPDPNCVKQLSSGHLKLEKNGPGGRDCKRRILGSFRFPSRYLVIFKWGISLPLWGLQGLQINHILGCSAINWELDDMPLLGMRTSAASCLSVCSLATGPKKCDMFATVCLNLRPTGMMRPCLKIGIPFIFSL